MHRSIFASPVNPAFFGFVIIIAHIFVCNIVKLFFSESTMSSSSSQFNTTPIHKQVFFHFHFSLQFNIDEFVRMEQIKTIMIMITMMAKLLIVRILHHSLRGNHFIFFQFYMYNINDLFRDLNDPNSTATQQTIIPSSTNQR